MQQINLNKTLTLDNEIQDLLLISIDDHIDTIEDKDGIRISGKISIGGTAKTLEGNKDFSDYIDLDVFLTYEEIADRNSLKVIIDDFDYKIKANELYLNIYLKMEGLKEIETTFLTKEDNEIIIEEEINEDKEIIIEEDRKEEIINKDINIEENSNELEGIVIIEEKPEKLEILEEKKKSLINSVFSNKRIKEEVSWKLHCVKEEKSYEEIAAKYKVDLKKLVSINKNEEIYTGKLIFLPLD